MCKSAADARLACSSGETLTANEDPRQELPCLFEHQGTECSQWCTFHVTHLSATPPPAVTLTQWHTLGYWWGGGANSTCTQRPLRSRCSRGLLLDAGCSLGQPVHVNTSLTWTVPSHVEVGTLCDFSAHYFVHLVQVQPQRSFFL